MFTNYKIKTRGSTYT